MARTIPLSRRHFILLTGATLLSALLPARPGRAQSVEVLSAEDAHAKAQSGEILLIDIRTPEEWAQTGVGEGAIGLDMTQDSFVSDLVALREANPDTPLALICRTGNRSGYVAGELTKRGFHGVQDVSEGMVGGRNGQGWLKRGLPIYPGTPETVAERRAAVLP